MKRLSAAVFTALERGGTVVTASPQQAYRIRLAWAEHQRATGAESWVSADVLPLHAAITRAWLRTLVDGDNAQPYLLSTPQELALWQGIVRAGTAGRFLQPHGTARAAMRAWRHMREWGLPRPAIAASAIEEIVAFNGWANEFERRCRAGFWVDAATAVASSTGLREARAPWIATGFDAPSPALRRLVDRLQGAGVDAQLAAGPTVAGRAVQAAFADPQAEWRAAALWARRRLLDDPRQRLLIVIPDLERAREEVERTFDEILQPATLLAETGDGASPFVVEGGVPLARYPLVACALTAVALACAAQPFDSVSAWLRSPYLQKASAGATDRARLDLELRRHAAYELDLSSLAWGLEHAARQQRLDEPLIAALRRFAQLLSGRRGLAQWSTVLSDALEALGWPGARERNSAEQQTLEKFHALLAELATLDPIVGSVDVHGLWRELRALAEQTAFQPETGDAPVTLSARIGDPALGLDGLWVAGLHANAWPRAPRPDPFLPWDLQRAAGMPEASAEGMLGLARGVTERLRNSAREVVFSWPQRLEDEECLPSPLVAGFAEYPEKASLAAAAYPYWRRVRASADLEATADERGPALPEGARVPGGARALSFQSQCAMRSFAHYRLRAQPMDVPEPGVDPRTRGILVHEALALLWGDLESQERLLALEPLARARLAATAVARASALHLERTRRWPDAVVELERERLRDLLGEWLDHERARAPFRVAERELEVLTDLGGHPLRLRIDRIDEMADGRRLLIDYKTGPFALADWFGDRPDDVQLPLYAIALAADGLAIARVSVGESSLKGVSSDPPIAPSRYQPRDWQRQLAQWRLLLERLASDLARGDARVNPKEPPDTCRTCHLHAFCRIDEIVSTSAAEPGNGA